MPKALVHQDSVVPDTAADEVEQRQYERDDQGESRR
jgi:hypothetical protein